MPLALGSPPPVLSYFLMGLGRRGELGRKPLLSLCSLNHSRTIGARCAGTCSFLLPIPPLSDPTSKSKLKLKLSLPSPTLDLDNEKVWFLLFKLGRKWGGGREG